MDRVKHFAVTVEKSADPAFDARFVMSASTPDRVKDTIDPVAYKSAAKIDKLIALWQHDPDRPIGFWTNLKADGDRLVGHIKLASTNLAQMVKQLIEDGVPLASSIGFRGKAKPNDHGGLHFKEIELLECSIVSVPAHPLAVQIAKSFGFDEALIEIPADAQPGDNMQDVLARAAASLQKSATSIHANPWRVK